MPHYIEYPLADSTTIWVEVEEHSGTSRSSSKSGESITSKIGFKQAFANALTSIKEVMEEFDDLRVDEAEIKFGLKSIGEAGIFAIGKVGGEMNYEVKLKWKRPKKKMTDTNK